MPARQIFSPGNVNAASSTVTTPGIVLPKCLLPYNQVFLPVQLNGILTAPRNNDRVSLFAFYY